MPYYVRVMSTAADCVPFRNLLAALDATKHHARLTLDGGTEGDWSRILLEHADGTYIALIERNPVQPGSLAEEELQEFSAEIKTAVPRRAAIGSDNSSRACAVSMPANSSAARITRTDGRSSVG